MIKNTVDLLKRDFAGTAAIVAAVSQLGGLKFLLDPATDDAIIFATATAVVIGTSFCSWRYWTRSRRERFHPDTARALRALSAAFAILALTGAGPGVYRFLIVHTNFLSPKPDSPNPPIILGSNILSLIPAAHAQKPNLTVSAMLDTSRTSVRCLELNSPTSGPTDEETDWGRCRTFSVPSTDVERFLFGWRSYKALSPDDARVQFERRFWRLVIRPAHKAMLAIPRLKQNPLIRDYEFPIKAGLYREWKQRLFSEDLFPTAAEWATLRQDTPELAAALRTYYVDVIGVLDPTYIVTVHNPTDQPVQITQMRYTSKYIDTVLSSVLGGYERPKYVLALKSGTHLEQLIPPVTIPPRGTSTFDLLVTTATPQPGSTYEVSILFGNASDTSIAALPPTHIRFYRGKAD